MQTARLVLIGFSGSGKSTVAKLLAARLGWQLIDTDADIEQAEGISVPEIFAQHGEPYFRDLERRALLTGLAADRAIVATGGGAVVDDALWSESALRRLGTLVVAFDVQPETVLDRLRRQQALEGSAVARPMIAGEDPLASIESLKERRQAIYDRADITIVVDNASPETIADEIESLLDSGPSLEPSLRLNAASASSDVYIQPGMADYVGRLIAHHWPASRRAWVITDQAVGALHGAKLLANLAESEIQAQLHTVPVGESSKSWEVAGSTLDWLLDGGIERSDVVIALGGGVIGDLAGFVAATVLRGVCLVQIPTSLLAMVDSSIGGKTGINHRTGKNLIGAFYQPPVVVIDPRFLQTLPPRELNAGWAEIVKHAVIQPSTPGGERGDLLTFLERNVKNFRTLQEPAITYAIRRNVALKAAVVEADERETGIRAYLNFGHTMGHAIEAADYQLLHGEAVAVGIRGALRLAEGLNLTSEALVRRVDALLEGLGLPTRSPADESKVLAKMTSDKKKVAGKLRWVLPKPEGGVAIRDDVEPARVADALRLVTDATGGFGHS
jgi:3-dehydroquinate synthase